MPITRCTLNGSEIHTIDNLYDQLSAQLKLPAGFGRNLDALWDVLSADTEGPLEIVWKDASASRKMLGADFDRVVQLFDELREERDDVSVQIELDA